MRSKLLPLLGVAMLAACGPSAGERWDFGMTHVDYIWDKFTWTRTLRESPAYDRYELPRLPPEGAIPVVNPMGEVGPAFTQQELTTVAAALPNPLPASAEVVARGKYVYQNHCVACHGAQGEGNGPVVGPGKFPFAPSVVTPTAQAYSDGYLYGITRVGRGLMPAYGSRIPEPERWALVHYLRVLQTGRDVAQPMPPNWQPVPPGPTLRTGAAATAVPGRDAGTVSAPTTQPATQ